MSPLPPLSGDTANRLLTTATANIRRDFPVHWSRLVGSPADLVPHRELHPVFGGSYDWHSCVHQTWLIVRLLRAYPSLPSAALAEDALSWFLTPAGCATEAAFFASAPHWERPYGWAWLLTLDAALAGTPWSITRLSSVLRNMWLSWIRDARLPVRTGTHSNTAFACGLVLDAARSLGDMELAEACEAAALRWYFGDTSYGAYEPDSIDFLSPALVEADLMRRVLDGSEFAAWLDAFLPDLPSPRWQVLREPVPVPHFADPVGTHLAGLALSRAWCWRAIAAALPDTHRYTTLAASAAAEHASVGWEYVFGHGYAAEHWLGTFAVYLELST